MSAPAQIADWPTVPACYGWLKLDCRGRWRLRDEVVHHLGLIAYIGANYRADPAGNWVVDNGPQKVYVTLEYTPWVWRLGVDGALAAHTGEPGGAVHAAFIDEDGVVLLQSERGIGVVDDRDLVLFIAGCRGRNGEPATEAELLALSADAGAVSWNTLPLQPLRRAEVPARFGFVAQPVAP